MYTIRDEPFMLVSDLDETMFGDDEASRAFKGFWERDARLRGSCLVYNTGRALDKWLSLWREKSWCLAAPDHLITSVGTKVFRAAPDVSPPNLSPPHAMCCKYTKPSIFCHVQVCVCVCVFGEGSSSSCCARREPANSPLDPSPTSV
jgi:hypothetical protein